MSCTVLFDAVFTGLFDEQVATGTVFIVHSHRGKITEFILCISIIFQLLLMLEVTIWHAELVLSDE